MSSTHSHLHHHQWHCHSTPPTPTPTCYCTMCYTTTHYSSPPPPPPPNQYPQTHPHAPPQTYPHAPPHNNVHAPPQTHLFQENPRQLSLNDPTVSSLIHRISALETTLRRRTKHSLRDAAARTIQTHFRAFLVQRSITLRHLKDLAFIKSSLNKLKSSVSNKPHFDSYFISRQSLNLLIKLDSIQGSDSMIRDGKRSITRELINFMDLIDEICTEKSQLISVKNVRFNNKNGVVLQREKKIRVSSENEKKISEILKNRIKSENRIEALLKNQPKAKKNVSFDENGNVYRLIERKNSHSSSSDGSEEEEEVEETGVSSKETKVEIDNEEEESLEMSENEMDPRKNLKTRIDDLTKKIQLGQECDDDDEQQEDDDDDEDDSFAFSAPLPAKMEYRVDSTSKKQTAKQ